MRRHVLHQHHIIPSAGPLLPRHGRLISVAVCCSCRPFLVARVQSQVLHVLGGACNAGSLPHLQLIGRSFTVAGAFPLVRVLQNGL